MSFGDLKSLGGRRIVLTGASRGTRLSVLRPWATATGMWKGIPGEYDIQQMIPPELVAESLEFLLAQSRRAWTETMVVLPPGPGGFSPESRIEEIPISPHNRS